MVKWSGAIMAGMAGGLAMELSPATPAYPPRPAASMRFSDLPLKGHT